jgi:hypothetical protein
MAPLNFEEWNVTYSDDYASSTSSFSGDQTGDIFGTPDTVPQSPVAAARVVDTQSGYMVVIKKKDERLALSVKRRIGTPPASHVLLTADESLQLSHVLDDSVKCLATPGDYFPNTASSQSPAQQGRRARHARKAALEAEINTADDTAEGTHQSEETHSHHGPNFDDLNPSSKKRKRKQQHDDHLDNLTDLEDRNFLDGPPKTFKSVATKYGAIAIGVVLVACVCIPMILAPSKYLNAAPPAAIDTAQQQAPDEFAQTEPAKATAVEEQPTAELNTIDDPANPLNTKAVNDFTRKYVTNMLNFAPKGYRRAQIEAMAAMSPVLMEKYWNETNFPVGIKDLPNEQKDVRIKKIVQEKVVDNQLNVTVKGRLGKDNPIALKLAIGANSNGELRVRQQTDLSSKK